MTIKPLSPTQTNNYLSRINYSSVQTNSLKNLQKLHSSHMQSVPFENLSIHWGERIHLNTDWLYEKIIGHLRGGFCYELNGLFSSLLASLKFDPHLLSARVWNSTRNSFGPPFDHLVIKIFLDDSNWLVDVGFGDNFLSPIQIKSDLVQQQGRHLYRLISAGDEFVYEKHSDNSGWIPQYVFSLEPHDLTEFNRMCQFHQTSKETSFTQKIICTKPTKNGRITISGSKLIETNGEKVITRELADPTVVDAFLENYFELKPLPKHLRAWKSR